MTASDRSEGEWAVLDAASQLPLERAAVLTPSPVSANPFELLKDRLLKEHPPTAYVGDGDGLCVNSDCVGGKIPNYTSGQDTDCPDCLKRVRLERLAQEFEASNIPVSELHTQWGQVNREHPSWQAVKRYCENIPAIRAKGYNGVFVGPPGRGKSLAGALVCRSAVEEGFSARMLTAYDLLSRIRASFSEHATETEHQIITSLAGIDFLVIDDVGAGETKGRALEERVFTGLIDAREKAKRPTIVTTNLIGSDLETALGFRALERIRYKAAAIVFNGPNERERRHRAEVAELDALVMGPQ